jgi:Sec7-like guanine-nucleotide exchange factor
MWGNNVNKLIKNIWRYVMAYSIIMLHTDAHSMKIEKSRKMTKD